LASAAGDDEDETFTLDEDIGKSRDGSRTDDEVVQRLVVLEYITSE